MDLMPKAPSIYRDDGCIHCMACGCPLNWIGGEPSEDQLSRFSKGEVINLECRKCCRRYEAMVQRPPRVASPRRILVEIPTAT